MIQNEGVISKLFDAVNGIFLFVFSVLTVLPFIYIVSASFTAPEILAQKGFVLIPKKYTLSAYEYIFSTKIIINSLFVSLFITVTGTIINLAFHIVTAYPLSQRQLPGKQLIMTMMIVTLLFNGGMIPSYILVQKLGWLNSYLSILIPGALGAFNVVIFKNFFQEIPIELRESARIDGCNEEKILIQIILPLTVPLLATFSVVFGVQHWNSWFNAILYLTDSFMWPVQAVLRQIVISANVGVGDSSLMDPDFYIPPRSVQMATIVVSTIPILCVYPFLQKYFTKGILMGSVKG